MLDRKAGVSWKLPLVFAGAFFSAGTVQAATPTDSVTIAFSVSNESVSNEIESPLPDLIPIPAGDFIAGSTSSERNVGYDLDSAAYNHNITRENRWYERERKRQTRSVEGFEIGVTPVTNDQYRIFVKETGHPAPMVSQTLWDSYGLVHPYSRVAKFQWKDSQPQTGRGNHPVVLVSHQDALAYVGWLSNKTGEQWRLPTEDEWEKAARGVNGNMFPFGNKFDPTALNSHDNGPFDTQPVGMYENGKSPFGLLDAAGQVYEWTADTNAKQRAVVKGGSWDDKGCGVCRPAARHTRPMTLKHILIGFRVVRESNNALHSMSEQTSNLAIN